MSDAVEVLFRNRFYPVSAATVEAMGTNAWTVRIPVSDPIHKKVRRPPTPEGWDGAVLLVGEVETEPGLGSGLRKGCVEISVYAI